MEQGMASCGAMQKPLASAHQEVQGPTDRGVGGKGWGTYGEDDRKGKVQE